MQQILIHGLGQTPSSWAKTNKNMKEKTKVACPNWVEMLQNKDINYTNLYHTFERYCDTFSKPLNLCGLSLGGILALHYGIEHPANVNSLVLIGTQYTMPKRLLEFQNAMFRLMPESMFRQMGFGKKAFIQLSKSMMELDFSHDLRKITCPVLVICGEKDSANKKASIELAKYIPHAELKVVAEAGHEVNVDKPEKLAEILNKFYGIE